MGRDGARRASWDFELLDLLFYFVDEVGSAGAVDDSMIEGEREGDYFGGFVFLAVRNQFAMGGANKERSD